MTIIKDKIKKYVQQVANNVCFPHIFAQQSQVLTAYKSLLVAVCVCFLLQLPFLVIVLFQKKFNLQP